MKRLLILAAVCISAHALAGQVPDTSDASSTTVGHTDSVGGSGTGNLLLSARRAAAVKDALSGRYGVAAGRLTTGGAGSGQPLATNTTLEGRAENRRVEIRRR